ncbi:MAG: alginate lyase family protein [Caldilineaceae bacterium]
MLTDKSTLAKPPQPTAGAQCAFLRAPYRDWEPAMLLAYFQARTTPRSFALRDEEQAGRAQIEQLLTNCFTYNDESYHLPTGFDWTANPSPDIEWLILLHKFYFAPGLGEEFVRQRDERYLHKWIELTEAWIDSVPLDFLSSDVTGRRVQNWIFAHHDFVTRAQTAAIPPAFYLKFLRSLQQQVNYLYINLTPARNHRTIELYAIFMAAVVFPEFADAERWLALTRRELVENIHADLRADGVHCEQSTDYHHLVVKNYLGVKRLAAANGIDFAPIFDQLLQKALDFAMTIHRPDGKIPSLSDGDSRSFLDLLRQGYDLYGNPAYLYVATQGRQGTPPSFRSLCFPAGGYTILRSGWGEGQCAFTDERYLVFDCGPQGEGNHGHLDLLSFEAAAFGQPLVVDPGRYTYHEPHPETGEVNWRARFRGTGYHNTVQVDGKEQIRYVFHKKKFKLRGPEPRWELRTFLCTANFDLVHGLAASAEYDAVHERIIWFAQRDYWLITDILRAPTRHRYDLHFHLADSAQERTTVKTTDKTILVQAPHLLLAQPVDDTTELIIQDGYLSRTYGAKVAAPVVRATRTAAMTVFHTVLYPYATVAPQVQVVVLPLGSQDKATDADGVIAVQVQIADDDHAYTDTFHAARSKEDVPYHYAYTRV